MRRVLRWGIAVAAVGALVAGSITVGSTRVAALDGSTFDPGYIISDSEFYASTSMSEPEIQTFLNSKVSVCRSGYTCLKDYSTTTRTMSADPMCSQYNGGGVESAARIIAKVAIACGVSPKVLLVMLQKEQGLITDTWPLDSQYRAAMGAGCPDTAACSSAQAGFFLQVYFAAWFLIRYGGPPGTGPGTEWTANYSRYAPGKTVNILYNPNTACGTRPVAIVNQPTASLYTYTPYTPNAAALANLGGTGDGCSSYGNRNFWAYYSNWFGSPTNLAPSGVSVSRVGGVDRFDTSAQLSALAGTVGRTVFVTNGYSFPDALSAAPAAAKLGGSLLLTLPDSIPSSTATELRRLAPSRIVVLGDEESITASVEQELTGFAPTIERWGGVDRYATSRQIVAAAFPDGASTVYIATGIGFPDALVASAAAGAVGAPVLLVDGSQNTLTSETRTMLTALGATRFVIAGGTPSVSAGIAAELSTLPGAVVERVGGIDRFQTAVKLSATVPGNPTNAYIASGRQFPDALGAAVLAAASGTPVLLSDTTCIPRSVVQRLIDLKVTSVTVLGREDTLSAAVAGFRNC